MLAPSYKEWSLQITNLGSQRGKRITSFSPVLLHRWEKKKKGKEKATDPENSTLSPPSRTNPHYHLSLQRGDN